MFVGYLHFLANQKRALWFHKPPCRDYEVTHAQACLYLPISAQIHAHSLTSTA